MKKLINFILMLVLSVLIISSAFCPTNAFASELKKTDAESYVLIDAATNQVILGKNENEVLVPASTTKVMTSILVLENTKLTDKVTIGDNPPNAEGTSLGLKKGEVYTVEDLMHGLLLESANDCAMALAEFVGGSKANFVKMMNDKAKTLGLEKTTFVNPSGLWENDNVTTNKTTAYELSLMMKEVLKYPDYIRISQAHSYKFPVSQKDTFEKWANNKNSLLFKNNPHYYAETIAGKCGYTVKSKHTFVAAAQKNGRTLILAIMKSSSKEDYFPFAKSLFEYGFNDTSLVKLYSKDEEVSTYKNKTSVSVPLIAGQDVFYVVNNKDFSKDQLSNIGIMKKLLDPKITYGQINIDKNSIKKGDILVTADLEVKGKKYTQLSLNSGIDIDKHVASNNSNTADHSVLVNSLIITALCIFLIAYMSYKKYKAYKQKRDSLDEI
ncbi:D-alanyl-D-alanine carboxypeptidase family protein [Inconstantimicrobium mannanitabidum]|uniref:D-alanyl-D-alanine carboxypeptidase n=1 Tax=Inconstantimicrobium mannanitabidum TaxID=1604901 RepID=A0ACB5R7X2_9CLOT|nr:D-alanyl-D-alanine carboxypeptidase family protein [Clostridium sp. TW13]GKX65136.1 D-alanyl-D-alanine carboxypeptidase [Clostridium sp. TW13]